MDLFGWLSRLGPRPAPQPVGDDLVLRVARLAIGSRTSVPELLRRAAAEVAGALGCACVEVYAWTPERDGLVLRASHGWSADDITLARMEPASGWIGRLAEGAPALLGPPLLGPPARVLARGLDRGVGAPILVGAEEGAGSWGLLVAWSDEPLPREAVARIAAVAGLLGEAVASAVTEPVATRIDGGGDGSLLLGVDGVVRGLDPVAEALLGIEAAAVVDRPIDGVPALAALAYQARGGGPAEVALGDVRVEVRSSQAVQTDGTPVVQFSLRDVTRLHQAEARVAALEAQLAHARRLESVGALAGGVAHDFNNLLTVVLTTGALVLRDERLSPQGRADVEQILRAAERGASLTRQLLNFSRHEPSRREIVSVGGVVEELLGMLDRLLGRRIHLETRADDPRATVFADTGQLEQIVLNLVLNARDAMPRGGRISVEVERVEIGDGEPLGVPPGSWVRLEVADDGVGMDAALQGRIFEPTFTSKPRGSGTGLGLATVRAIVDACQGHILVQSTPGAGSRFTVLLPAAEGPLEEAPSIGSPTFPALGETVLLVDGDPLVREGTQRVLQSAGFTVLAAGSAKEALEVWDEGTVAVDLLVSEVDLPGEPGVDLLHHLRKARPLLPAVLVSGSEEAANAAAPDDVVWLDKPFHSDELLDALHDALDADGTLDAPSAKVRHPALRGADQGPPRRSSTTTGKWSDASADTARSGRLPSRLSDTWSSSRES